jgi:hypothetical protein
LSGDPALSQALLQRLRLQKRFRWKGNTMTRLHVPQTLSSEFPYAATVLTVPVIEALAFLVTHTGAIGAISHAGVPR